MEGKEPDSRYLVLWLCVFLTAGIVFVGWFVALRSNFNKANEEMNSNVKQTFEQAQQEVMDSFDEVGTFLKENEANLGKEAAKPVDETATKEKTDLIATEQPAEPAVK